MRNIFKRVGASALAAATVVTGLSFGPAALAAPSDSPSPNASAQAPLVLAFDSGFYGFSSRSDTKDFHAIRLENYNDAAAAADKGWSFPGLGETAKIRSDDNKCLYAQKSTTQQVYYDSCYSLPSTAESDWTRGADGRIFSKSFVIAVYAVWGSDRHKVLGAVPTQSYIGDPLAGPISGVGLQATTVENQKPEGSGRTVLTGKGTPGAEIRYGGQTAVVSGSGKTGTWSMTVSGKGGTDITLEQWVDVPGSARQKYDSLTVRVEGPATIPSPTDCDIVFDSDVSQRATLVGRGTSNADITVVDSKEKQYTGTAALNGRFEVTVDSTGTGSQTYSVRQSTSQGESEFATVTKNFGNAVSIATPSNDANLGSGFVTISGGTQAGARLTVKEGSTTLVNPFTASSDSYSENLTFAPGRHTVTVSQLSKGNTVTEKTVTFTVEDAAVADLVVTTPANDSSVPSTGKMITVSGTGVVDSVVRIVASNGRLAGSGSVDKQGRFSFPAEFGTAKYQATVEQVAPGGAKQTKVVTFTVFAADAINLPFTVTTPQSNTRVTSIRDKVINVAGTGKADSTVTITAANGRPAGSGRVGKDGQFSFDAEFAYTTYDAKVEMTPPAGPKETIQITNFTVVADGSSKAFQVTSPVSNGIAPSTNKMVTFTGTGKVGARINVIAVGTGRLAGFGNVDSQGNFRIPAEFAALKYSAVVEMLPVGGQKESIRVTDFTVVAQ